MRIELVRPGPDSLAWLRTTVAELKAGNPLKPVTVVVSNYVLGRFLQRHLGRTGGSVNVRAVRLADLAVTTLGGPAFVPDLLTQALEMGAVRCAVERSGRGLRSVAHHVPLYQALLRLFHELRRAELPSVEIEHSEAARAATATYATFRELTSAFADATSIRQLAADALIVAPTAPECLRETGDIVVYLPPRIDPVDARMLAALARFVEVRVGLAVFGDQELIGDEEAQRSLALLGGEIIPSRSFSLRAHVSVLRAPDPTEELREIVRRIVAALESGVPLPRQAILYRQTEPYASLVRETLTAAGLPWHALDGRPLDQTLPGRALLAAVNVGASDFARGAVLAWLTALPDGRSAEHAHSSEWDRVSRDANVVRGAAQWQQRLERFASESELQAEQRDREGSAPWAHTLRGRAARAREIARSVAALAAALHCPPNGSSWSLFVDWAESLRVRFASIDGTWPEPHDRASDLIRDTLASMAQADEFRSERPLTLDDFVTTLQASLQARSVPEGSLGEGVVVGPIQSAVGFAFDRVHVVGMVEGAFPPQPVGDPFFPDEALDPLQRAARMRAVDRRAFLAALCAADDGEVTLGVPESLDGRAAFPSRWALEITSSLLDGAPLDALRFRRLSESSHSWLRRVHSTLDGLLRAPAASDIHERRLAEAAAWVRAGRILSAHPLGMRSDLPLQSALAFADRRRSSAFTAYDGNLAELSAAMRLRTYLDGTRPLSPTSLETWATCPYRFFLESVLRVAPTEEPEEAWTIAAAEKGSLVHDVLEQFFLRLAQDGRPAPGELYTDADFALLESLARQRLERTEHAGAAGHPLVWQATQRELLADLRTFLIRDTEWRRASGTRPHLFEQAFGDGQPWPAVDVPVPGGVLRLRGRMDRVDLSPDGKRAHVFDYKTGSASSYNNLESDPIDTGRKLQLAIYTRAVRQALGDDVQTSAAYWFISSRGEFKRVALPPDAELVDRRLDNGLELIAQGISQGAFPAVTGSDDYLEDRGSNCRFCPFDLVCPTSRDQDWQRKQSDGGAAFLELKGVAANA